MTAIWIGFAISVVTLIVIDLLVVRSKNGEVSPKSAGLWTVVYVLFALAFSGIVYFLRGPKDTGLYLTAWVIEYALSVDNLFVFLVIFSYFKISTPARHRLLYWGVFGAFILRGLLIFSGTELVSRFRWLLYFFGAFLLWTSWKLLTKGSVENDVDPEKNAIVRLARKILPLAQNNDGVRFFTREKGLFKLTPLVIVLVAIETSDLLFAFDSIPAVFSISQDAFIVFTSNVCAILGLRSLFFVVASLMEKFRYLQYGLGVILGFVGVKLFVETFFHHQLLSYENWLIAGSLLFVVFSLVASILMSALIPVKNEKP